MKRWEVFNELAMENKSINIQALEIVREKYKEYAGVKREYPINWSDIYEDVKKWLNEEWSSHHEHRENEIIIQKSSNVLEGKRNE